jgi:hypothetical protein
LDVLNPQILTHDWLSSGGITVDATTTEVAAVATGEASAAAVNRLRRAFPREGKPIL